jgi:hypothetical protein
VRRKLVALGALLAGAFTGLTLMRRLGRHPNDRVDVYYEDGSVATLPEAQALIPLALARDALAAARR